MDESSDAIRVLHVEDDPDYAELTASLLQQENGRIAVETATTPDEGLARLGEEAFDCIVSDYNMPGRNGIELLEAIREDHPDLPFILYTGKGSEEVASDAISAGVTDYLQKEGGMDQYAILANRIENAVAQYRAEREVKRTREYFGTVLEHSSDYVMVVGTAGEIDYISPAVERVMGYPPEELEGTNAFESVHPEDQAAAGDAFAELIDEPDEERVVEFRAQHTDGSWRWLEVRGRNLLDDPVIEGVIVNARDVTERRKHEEELEERNQRLDKFVSVVSHDLRNPLNVATSRLELLATECDSNHIQHIECAHDRMETLLENLLTLARSESGVELETVDVTALVEEVWETVETGEATLATDIDRPVLVDRNRLGQAFENLFRNAIQHGGESVTVRVGLLEDGFYVEDDGHGIPEDERDRVLETGYSGSLDDTRFGLSIVGRIVHDHEWEIRVTDSADGGTRFEIIGVTFADE